MGAGLNRGCMQNGDINRILCYFIILILFLPLVSNLSVGYENTTLYHSQENYLIGACQEYGRGRCVFLGDIRCFTNFGFGNIWGGYDVEDVNDGKEFILDIISWLGEGKNRLLIDQAHCEIPPINVTWDGIGEFTKFINRSGYLFDFYGQCQNPGAEDISYELLSDYDVLLLIGLYHAGSVEEIVESFGFSNNEISNITRYVHNGGGLLVVGNGEDGRSPATNELYNPLLEKFDIKFNQDLIRAEYYTSGARNYDFIVMDHHLTENVMGIPASAPCSISIGKSAQPLMYLYMNGNTYHPDTTRYKHSTKGVLAASIEYGFGRAVVCSNGDLFMNRGLGNSNNMRTAKEIKAAETFVRNIANWLGSCRKKILIDQSHCECSPYSDGHFNIQRLDQFLKEEGFNVTYNDRFDYRKWTQLTFENMSEYDMVFLIGTYTFGSVSGNVYRFGFSEPEIENITHYVETGGGLLIVAEGEKGANGATNDVYRPLAEPFGVYLNEDAMDWDGKANWKFAKHPITENISSLLWGCSCTITITGNTTALVYVEIISDDDNNFLLSIGRIMIIAAILIISLGVIIHNVGASEVGKYKFFSMLAPLYTKLKRDRLLENKTRNQIQEHIQSHPGVHFNAIKHTLCLSNGSLTYHLKTLEREGYITSKRNGMYKKFFPVSEEISDKSLLKNKSQKKIYNIILTTPGLSQKEIAKKIDLTLSTVNFHIKNMVKTGVVRLERTGNRTSCYLNKEIS